MLIAKSIHSAACRLALLCSAVVALAGCTSYIQSYNQPQSQDVAIPYSVQSALAQVNSGEYSIILSFSGGGTRAAALSYGVLQKLNALSVRRDKTKISLLDEVDFISSVSGGSFTAAYYGLYGKDTFLHYEQAFLKKDVRHELFQRLFKPSLWFSDSSRTDEAIDYYQSSLFNGASIGDFYKPNAPMIIINASDLGQGVRFSFIQEYFDLICSNVNSYPVAHAVAASAAVPLIFNPIVVKNHKDCVDEKERLLSLTTDDANNPINQATLNGLLSYQNKDKRKYIHLVDGGITDNLGLLALYDIIEVSGGGEQYIQQSKAKRNPHLIIISVDASTKPESSFEMQNTEPSIGDTLASMTDIQLHRYNAVSKNLLKDAIQRYASIASDKQMQIQTYFVDINLNSIEDPRLKRYINNIPTSMTLDEQAVDALIAQGNLQLMKHPEFKRFLNNINAEPDN